MPASTDKGQGTDDNHGQYNDQHPAGDVGGSWG